ncbi:arsenate reductase (glutaredoxin) [Rhodospirillaceae bacterium]|jgi:arsenate reductase (glutaredoxin)|nr:arsenate reductase (glutaredoxin) [Alphaproteobacteria bacterium]MDC1441595.1 arsenate reductase (glutaredoxin) [Rhodospirillaceae bacterium]
MSVIIYHNPRCSKSRQALSLLHEKNIDTDIVEYLKSPPTVSELKDILLKLGYKPRQLLRKNEQIYKDLDLGSDGKTDDDLVNAMVDNPILIERPVIISGDQVTIGRPPESILDIL